MKKWWLGLVLVVGLAACGGGGDSGRDRSFTPRTSRPNLSVQDADSLGGRPEFNDAACLTARVGFTAAQLEQGAGIDVALEAINAITHNYTFVFPIRYTKDIPQSVGTYQMKVFLERMVLLCDRELGPATEPLPASVPAPVTAPPPPPPPPPPPAAVYDLTGTGTVMVTLANETGGTEQFTTELPYHRDLATAPDFLYISAQLQGTGEVTCQVRNSLAVVQTATSSGQYVIATCSGSG